jgi:hypothetical protein
MQYFLTDAQLERIKKGLRAAIAIPFIDDVEDYIVEAILEYTKEFDGVDPFTNIRSKRLYDVVDTKRKIGYSVKSLKWVFQTDVESEFELVIQRADIFKKAAALGFEHLDVNSDPQTLGAALLEHWRIKVEGDATFQNVNSKRIFVLLKSIDSKKFAFFEEDIKLYQSNEITWRWTDDTKTGLQGIRNEDQMCVYRWYPNQKQFFERFKLPANTQSIDINPIRLDKAQVVDILLPYLEERQ